jgi:hypothetical protein
MKTTVLAALGLGLVGVVVVPSAKIFRAQNTQPNFRPTIPRTWDDAAMAELEVPLADPVGSPKHASAVYYYKIPVRPIYKSYTVYAPGHEPPGYLDWLTRQEPVVIWDDKGHWPPLKTEADWRRAGEIAFDAPVAYGFNDSFQKPKSLFVRDPEWYRQTGSPITRRGELPFYRYVIRQKGTIEIGVSSCGTCHTRVMPDGSVIKGAQGNFPFERDAAYEFRTVNSSSEAQLVERVLYTAPWLRPDPQAVLSRAPVDEIAARHGAIPAGVLARHRSSPFCPPHVPDLIGVKERHYLDATGLQQQHSIVDLMRYAALNQGADDLASYAGFVPAGYPDCRKLPDPDKVAERYSDEQLYALARYIYSIQPPPNPNWFDEIAARGQRVFEREGCTMCHTPPLYTNNKLTPAEGFTVPEDHLKKYEILPISVGTDPNLTMKTRRGTGYYKVPSLKGVWYRSMFGHNGWCATLEDWFDPRRVRDDYVPTGFKPYGAKTYAVKGHAFGLDLSDDDKKALIVFLKTL